MAGSRAESEFVWIRVDVERLACCLHAFIKSAASSLPALLRLNGNQRFIDKWVKLRRATGGNMALWSILRFWCYLLD